MEEGNTHQTASFIALLSRLDDIINIKHMGSAPQMLIHITFPSFSPILAAKDSIART